MTDLSNVIYTKTVEDYPQITCGSNNEGHYAQMLLPESLSGEIITEAGLFNQNDVLIAVAKTHIDLTESGDGLEMSVKQRIYLSAVPASVRQTKWTKYLSRQQNTIQNNWEPKKFRDMNKNFVTTDGFEPVYISNTTIQTDKNGNVISQHSEDINDLKITKIECLPKEYSPKTFTLTINKNYYKYKGAKKTEKTLVIQTSPDSATVKISKNSRPPVFGHIQYALLCAIKNLEVLYNGGYYPDCPMIFGLLLVPIGIVTTVGGALACSFAILLFALTGGDIHDAE